MTLHADHALFFEGRDTSVKWSAFVLVIVGCVLLLNAGLQSTAVSFVGASMACALLLFAHARGRSRIKPALAWALSLVGFSLLCGVMQYTNKSLLVGTSARLLCGVLWILWLGTQVDWVSIRQILYKLRVPKDVVDNIDRALMHGIFTQREWAKRLDTARLRLGSSHVPLATLGPLLGEGALHAFTRVEHVQENAALRDAACEGTAGEDIVQLEKVSVERGGKRILEELDLRLAKSEWLLLCGPSGVGKSSLLRLLAGLDGVAQGRITRFGQDIVPGTALRDRLDGRVALLCQNPEHHFIASTVAEDIAWGLLRRGIEADEARHRSHDIATSLRIAHLLERPCHQLSFGEQRRAALAGLLVLEPALLLLDEPTAGLDPVAAHELRVLVEQLVSRTKAACVWATHDLHSLPPQATRVALLRENGLIFDGPHLEGLSKPWLLRAGLALQQEEQKHIIPDHAPPSSEQDS